MLHRWCFVFKLLDKRKEIYYYLNILKLSVGKTFLEEEGNENTKGVTGSTVFHLNIACIVSNFIIIYNTNTHTHKIKKNITEWKQRQRKICNFTM